MLENKNNTKSIILHVAQSQNLLSTTWELSNILLQFVIYNVLYANMHSNLFNITSVVGKRSIFMKKALTLDMI